MSKVRLTKRIEFSASHRYYNDAWAEARNREVFGPCSNASGHGHNYLLEVTVEGEIAEESGMVVNLYDLNQVLKRVLLEFDHKHLNLDTPYFRTKIPTTENLAGVLWRQLVRYPEIGRLRGIRLFEEEDLSTEVSPESFSNDGELAKASLTRRYHFSAAHDLGDRRDKNSASGDVRGTCRSLGVHGHNYLVQVTIGGGINPQTGMVTDLSALDRIVEERVIRRFHGRNLNEDSEFRMVATTGIEVARLIWNVLATCMPGGNLAQVTVGETADTFYAYEGA